MADVPFVPIEVVSRKLTVSTSTIRAWVRTGLIPRDLYIKIGYTYRFDLDNIIKHFSKEQPEETENTAPEETPADQLELAFGTTENPDNDL